MNRPNLSVIKRCSKCLKWQSIGQFGQCRKSVDGLKSQCRSCANAGTKKWRDENPEKWKASRARWKAANPEKVRAIHRNTSHKRYRRKRHGIGAGELLEWENAQPKVCHWCGKKCKTWHVDHRAPLCRGGEHELNNLVIACVNCNLRKQARDPIEFARSLGKLL